MAMTEVSMSSNNRQYTDEFRSEAVKQVVEHHNRTVRYAWLARTLLDTIEQVQDKATRWLWTYNHERPNMALGGITPTQRLAMAA